MQSWKDRPTHPRISHKSLKSGYFPKSLGALPIIGCFAYLGWLLKTFLAPDAPAGIGSALLVVAGIGEGAFIVWLVVKGVRLPAAAG